MKKILITGANGQLGSEINELAALYPNFEFVFTDVAELDITKPDAIEAFLKDQEFNYLVNCAAYTAVDKAEEDTEMAFLINRDAVKYLALASKKHNMAMVHVSTDYVFDGTNHIPYKESDPTKPNSAYGRTKEAGEKEFLASGVDGVIVRTSWLYSSFGNNFVKTMLRLGAERDELRVIFDQIGTPTYAPDLAKTILDILVQTEKDGSKLKPAIYHFSNEGVCSWYDFAKEIIDTVHLKCMVVPIETKDYPLPANRPSYSVLNKGLVKEKFGIEIPHWKESLIRCLKELKVN
ncbi:MAG: dTDP-4-dehydrorhamnose reductase [Bacteroidales bacterium]|nr:dTDP-4-dehydrorhamnose reductase [Bacteroidales bacterium]MCF8456605.1 dTDP-4-dehydrorhamnose reductase [Bacteroidales bacterium]